MELKLEVVLSSSIKRKKPWPRFCWLGQEKESVFLLDDKRISEINMVSGRTKKRTPKLHPLLNRVVTMATSHNGLWLCGLLVSGELFLWNKDKDLLKTAASAPPVIEIITAVQGNARRLCLQVSGDGMRVLFMVITGQVFLWECMDVRCLMGVRDGTVKGHWAHIQPLENTTLPSLRDKEASQHTVFIKTEAVGDICLSAFVFTSGKKLIITCLKIQWEEGHMKVGSLGYNIEWATRTYNMSHLTPPCQPVKSRGALVPAFSPDGQMLAIVLNQRQTKATQVLFVSTQNFVSVSCGLGGCGSKKMEIPCKYIRSYWVGSVSWSPDSLFLACVLKRGSLLMLARLGGLLTLTSSGCNIDYGPAHFLPLHPLVTYRPTVPAGKGEVSLSSSSLSVQDVLRQRYSVTWHPRLLYFIVSDGYMATVMRVLDRSTPAFLLKALLKDARKDLEKASRILDKSETNLRAWLELVSGLNLDSTLETLHLTVTHGSKRTDSIISTATDTLPLFLQDQGALGGTKELIEKVQTFFEDDSDLEGPPAGSHVEDGRLEFASMFDTLHALDTQTDTGLVTESDVVETEMKTSLLHRDLGTIQSKLLTAWAFGMSLGNAVEHRIQLLKFNLYCVLRFAALLHLISTSTVHTGKKSTSDSTCLQHILKALLTFLPWDSAYSDGPCCLGLIVDLCRRLIRLLLTPLPESYQTSHCRLSSQMLSTALLIMQLVSDSLDHTYSLQDRTLWSSAEKENNSEPKQVWSSDVYYTPLLQTEKEEKPSSLHQGQPCPQRPSSRLFGVWQWLYKITQQYMEELKVFKGCDGWEEEQQHLSVIVSQIQASLQATGERLEEGSALLSYPGEQLFLCGLYPKSADAWRSQICEERVKSCNRSVFQETRLCLALLYSLLSQYRLREAQELGDHMAQLILHRAGKQKDPTHIKADSLPCSWLPMDLHSDAACAVVQTLGRFMASYFANQPLYIFPPHNVAVLPPLHVPHAPTVGRLVPLCQQEVSRAVRQQHLSEVWTVDYAQDLLLLGGLLPETVWLAYHLGDWKTAVSLSLAYTSYCSNYFDFTRLKRRELRIPKVLEPESIFQAELECLLANKSDSKEQRDKDGDKSFSDPSEGEDWDLLQVSIQEILKASVMAGVNVMSSPLSSLLDTAKDLCSYLPTLVPSGLYLPSPPLYCPQPSPNTQDPVGTLGQFAEVASRHKVSGVLQRLLLLLRSARCCHPAAEWYISHLRRARHLLHKIKKKYSYPSAVEQEKAFPEGLMKFVTRSGFFRRGPNKDGHLDPDTIQTIICFRELCGLCWMLHVRDQLSISCRKYQAARQHNTEERILGDPEVRTTCVDALHWVCRYLPFSHFLNAEEILQDILLSLVSELPPISLVADTLVQAFPEEEESVRVPLREKYNSLLQRLRKCSVLEGEKEEANELMMILIRDKHRQRRKHLGRVQRHLAQPELHLWEKEELEEEGGSKHGMAMLRQLSLGTSLSTSTLTDCGFPPVCSDGDTDAVSPEQRFITKISKKAKKVRDRKHAKKSAVKTEEEKKHPDDAKVTVQPSLPVIGTWEFELEDEEYLNFLELFLSYVLEKDSTDGGDSGSDLPLLKGFSSRLRERELHSITFDVLTTIHRRQRDGHHPGENHWSNEPPVFRAGCCYKPIIQDATQHQTSSVWSETPISRTSLSVSSLPGLRTDRQRGLFGLQQQSSVPLAQGIQGGHSDSETSPIRSAFALKQPFENRMFGFSASVEAVTELQQGLDPKLEAQFPELGRLLEWMVRWADRRVLLGHHSKKKKERGGGTADEGVVIRVKASAPAVLTSLNLLEYKYSTLLGTDHDRAHIQVPETHWTVAPVLQPGVERKLERDSSVDTGYPGSANTPITGLDHNQQQGELFIGSCTDEPEELTFSRTPLLSNQDQLISDTQMRLISDLQQPCFDGLDDTSEKDGENTESEGLEVSSSVFHENIGTPETSLRLADLDLSKNGDDTSTSISLHSDARSLQAPAPPVSQPLPPVQTEALFHEGISHPTGILLPNTIADPPSLHPQSLSDGPATAAPAASNQPLSTDTPPMRQRLGEDLFRLVQHINYMSLMEVLGASFSNLQLAQQSTSLAHSNMNSSRPSVLPPHGTNLIPQTSTFPVQTTISVTPQTHACVPSSGPNNHQFSQAAACLLAGQPAVQSSVKTPPTDVQRHISGAALNDQEIHPLSVQAGTPEIHFIGRERLIPSSQGLLTTTDISHTIPTVPVLQPPNGSIENDPNPQVLNLKLLHLLSPPLPQQSVPHYLLTQGPQKNPALREFHQRQDRHQAASKIAEEEKRCGTARMQISYKQSLDLTPRKHEPLIQTSERSRGQEFNIIPPILPSHAPAPTQSLRLLQFRPAPHNHITFPKLPIQLSSRPSTFITAPMGETPMIKLLHMESGPKMMLPQAAPLTQAHPLISTEKLTSSLIGRQNTESTFISPSSSSSKRQKRREKKENGKQKTEVTFRPNESIIPAQEPTDEPGNEASAKQFIHGQAIQHGSLDSLLTGQRILERAMSTSAELHAFASTCKRPPECHDAFTNTDPACPVTLVDKAVSTSVTASSPKSQGLRNFLAVQDREETPKDCDGHQFISVLDLEDQVLHQDLPSHIGPEVLDALPTWSSSPTSAQLHILATSVIRSTAVSDPQPSNTENLPKHTPLQDIPVGSPSLSHAETSRDPERVSAQVVEDHLDSEICQAIKSQCTEPHRASSIASTAWFSSHLSKLDAQLAALQNIADSLEKDFSKSRVLVNTIERLTPGSASDVKSPKAVKKTVRLSLPQEAWAPGPDVSAEQNVSEEEEENQEDEYVLHSDSYTPERKPSFHFSTSHSQRAASSYSYIPPSKTHQLNDAAGISHVWADENLGQSGLSDTAEILDELIKEGYLSPPHLDLPISQTHQSSILDQQQSAWMSQKSVLPEEKRRELRMWMRKKQRERLAVYQKHRESLRETERKPFSASGAVKTKRNQSTLQKTREEKRLRLLEQYNQRTSDAWSLVSDFTTSPPILHGSVKTEGAPNISTTQSTSALRAGSSYRAYSASANEKRSLKSQSGQPQSHINAWTVEVQGKSSENHYRRLGLHRPVTSLPKDRLSQVTRRGMLTDTKRHKQLHIATQNEERHVGYQTDTGLNRRGRRIQREQTRVEKREEENLWEPSSEIHKQLRLEEFDSNEVLAGLLDEQHDGSRAGVSGLDWLDNLSESANSSLSKIDWAAIEKIVAAEED